MELDTANLKKLIGPEAEGQDDLLLFALTDAKDAVRNYCNIIEIPEELNTTVLRIAADIWRREGYGKTTDQRREVKSVSDGSQSVSFTTPDDSMSSSDPLSKYASKLRTFRRLRW